MRRKILLIKACILVSLFAVIGLQKSNAQTTDTIGKFEPGLTGKQLVYAEVVFHDVNENGNFDASFNVSQDTIKAWGDYSTSLAFYDEGFQVRDGGGFGKSKDIIPIAGEVTKIWLALDIDNNSYQTFVQTTAMEEPETVLDTEASFRFQPVTAINYWSTLHNPGAEPDSVSVIKVELTTDSDPTLKSLSTNISEIEPVFSSDVTDYELAVPYGTSSIGLDAVANGMGASVSMFDGLGNAIEDAANIPFTGDGIDIEIVVTAFDGTELSYYLAIFVDEGQDDATLKDIELSIGALDPIFVPETKTYTVVVPVGTSSIDVTGITNYPTATVTGDGTITLTGGTATAVLNVTSSDGTATDTYTVNIEETDGTNYALSLPGVDGNSSNIDISGVALNSLPFTIEMWIKPEGDQNANSGLLYNRNGDQHAGIQYASNWQQSSGSDDRIRFMTNISGDYGVVSDVASADGWHHLATVLTENSRTIYLDGIEVTDARTIAAYDFTAGSTYIGYDVGSAGRAFKGLIDEVRIWSDSISGEQLKENKYEVLNGDEANLLAYWNFDINNASQAIDMTGGLNGIITGGTYVESFPRANLELDTLYVTEGKLKPEFSPLLTEYYVTLPIGATSMTVSAVASDETTTVSGTGAISVSGMGTDTVKVTSSDGKYTQTYAIHYIVDADVELQHSYTFADGTANDMVGSANGYVNGGMIKDGAFITSADDEFITLPAEEIAINKYPSITLEAYVTIGANEGYSMTSYFGGYSGANALWQQPTRGGDESTSASANQSRTQISGGATVNVGGTEGEDGENHHYVTVVSSDTLFWYIDGALAAKTELPNTIIAKLSNENAWIGKSGWNDPEFIGTVYEFNIYKGAMDAATVATRSLAYPVEDSTSNATLSELTVADTVYSAFNPYNLDYEITLPIGTTDVPAVDGTTAYPDASHAVTAATGIPGKTIVTVTAEDGTTTVEYSVSFVLEPSTDTTLSDLTVDGTTISGFSASVQTYEVTLDGGTTAVPTVEATATDANASVEVTPAASLPGTTEVKVTAEDGTSIATYTISFVLGTSNDATLSDLAVDGTTVTGFSASVISYDVQLPEGTTAVPTVTAVANHDSATVNVTAATALPGTTSVVVTAEDGTEETYSINFTVITGIDNPTLSSVKVYPTVSDNNFMVSSTDNNLVSVSVYNLSGRLISITKANSDVMEVSVPSKGMYLIKVETKKDTGVYKVIKTQ